MRTVQTLESKNEHNPGCVLFPILRLSFEVVFWTFLIIHGEIKVTLALCKPKEGRGGFYRVFMSSSNLFPSHDAEHSITRQYAVMLFEMQAREIREKVQQLKRLPKVNKRRY